MIEIEFSLNWNWILLNWNWTEIELKLNFHWIEIEFSLNWNWIFIELKLNFHWIEIEFRWIETEVRSWILLHLACHTYAWLCQCLKNRLIFAKKTRFVLHKIGAQSFALFEFTHRRWFELFPLGLGLSEAIGPVQQDDWVSRPCWSLLGSIGRTLCKLK